MSEVIAAVDSSGRAAGVCILAGGAVVAERTLDAGRTHSETLLPLLEQTLGQASLGFADVGLYAVTGGPGSFTGLRIGMALVKGLALPGGTPAVAVSTLEALALGAALEAGLEGTVAAALDARRGEVYWAAFCAAGGTVTRLTADAAEPAATAAATLCQASAPVFFVGDGAEMCYTTMQGCRQAGFVQGEAPAPNAAAGTVGMPEFSLPPLPRPPIARGAALLARRHWLAGQAGPAATLRPQYLRLSQAERQRKARLEGRPNPADA